MRVWHLLSNRWNSAITEYAVSAVIANLQSGHEVFVSVLENSPAHVRMLATKAQVFPTESFGPGKYAALVGLSKQINAEAIVTHGGPETTAAHFFKGASRLIRVYGYNATDKGPFSALAQYMGHTRVDHLIAPSEIVAKGLRAIKGDRVSVVTLGCDDKRYYMDGTPGESDRDLVIFGRLDPVKGHREFMPVFKELLTLVKAENLPKPRLRIVGLPANVSRAHLETAAKEHGLTQDDISIECERVENLAKFMSTTRLAVVSSLGSEIICRVAEEFLLCGTPVVTTSVGSLPGIFVDAGFGLAYSGDAFEAARSILSVYRQAMSEDAKARQARADTARKYFSINAMSQQLDKVLGARD